MLGVWGQCPSKVQGQPRWGSKWRSPKLKTFASEDKFSQKLAPIFHGCHDEVIYHNTHVNQQCVRSIEACIEAMLVSFF